MTQQINLLSSVERTQRQRFTARPMAQALAVFVALGTAMGVAWTWYLQKNTAQMLAVVDDQSRDIQSVKVALTLARQNSTPVGPAMHELLGAKRTELVQREQLLAASREGLLQPGMGHSDRLALVANSIPPAVWVTTVKADNTRFEVGGFTLEPAALNDWVARLGTSPLMYGLKLSAVQVENATDTQGTAKDRVNGNGNSNGNGTETTGVTKERGKPEVWSFNLVNLQPRKTAVANPGAKP